MILGVISLAVCALYAGAWLLGWYLTNRGRLDVRRVMQSRRAFTDPLTRRFQRWCQTKKMEAIRRQQWGRLWLLIFANNLGAVALVGRTLYGMTLVPAVYFTYRQGLGHGTFSAQSSMHLPAALQRVAILEFGAYLLATALGVNLTMTPLVGGALGNSLGLLVGFYPVVAVALLVGAWLEVNTLRSTMPMGVQLPEGLNVEELRARALELIQRRPGGSA